MVRTWTRDNGIPDNRLIRGIRGRPGSGHVDKDLFRVPCEQGGEISGEGKADVCVFFFFRGVVVGTASDSVCLL